MGTGVCSDDGELGACRCVSSADAGPLEDDGGPLEDDAGTPDAGAGDAGHDASTGDAGAHDAGPRDAGSFACSVVPQGGCGSGQACRLSEVGGRSPGNGPPACGSAGLRREGEACSGEGDCRAGLFCWTVCRRYCVPGGDPCPDIEGSPHFCNVADTINGNPVGLGYCDFRP